MQAQWTVRKVKSGISVIYENAVTQKRFDCGVCQVGFDAILEFILAEGDSGDIIHTDSTPLFVMKRVAA